MPQVIDTDDAVAAVRDAIAELLHDNLSADLEEVEQFRLMVKHDIDENEFGRIEAQMEACGV